MKLLCVLTRGEPRVSRELLSDDGQLEPCASRGRLRELSSVSGIAVAALESRLAYFLCCLRMFS